MDSGPIIPLKNSDLIDVRPYTYEDGQSYLCGEHHFHHYLDGESVVLRAAADAYVRTSALVIGDVICATEFGEGNSGRPPELWRVENISRSLNRYRLTCWLLRHVAQPGDNFERIYEEVVRKKDQLNLRCQPAAAEGYKPAPSQLAESGVAARLRELKDLYDDGILTEKEYESKRRMLVEEL